MIQDLLIAKQFSLAKTAMFAGPTLSFFGVEIATGNTVWGVVASGFFTMCGIIFMNRHRVIAANAVAEMNRSNSDDLRMSAMFDRLHRLHQEEIQFWKEEVKKQQKAEVLIRATKHRLISAYFGAASIIRDREEQLRENGIKVEHPYKQEVFKEITGAEDAAMIKTLFDE